MDELLENNAGKELIEATQEVVIDAVNDVGNIIKTTTEGIANTNHELFYQSPEFWVGMAFVTVVAVLYIPLKKIFSRFICRHPLIKRQTFKFPKTDFLYAFICLNI